MIDDIREWISDNLRYILLGLAGILIILMIILVVKLVTKPKTTDQNTGAPKTQNEGNGAETVLEETEDMPGAAEGSTETGELDTTETPSELVKDDAEVLTLIREYYTARAAKDITALSQVVTPWDSATQENILRNDLIESYNEISTYSQQGMTDDSYVVFVSCKAKIPDYDTLVPSLRVQYLVTEEDDLKVLSNYEADPDLSAYVNGIAKNADVQQLLAKVNSDYEAALDSDERLKAYLTELNANASTEENAETPESGDGAGDTRTALYDLNIRQETSTSSAVIGGVPANAQVEVVQDVEDGWTKINYNPGTGVVTGYVRTEYLQ